MCGSRALNGYGSVGKVCAMVGSRDWTGGARRGQCTSFIGADKRPVAAGFTGQARIRQCPSDHALEEVLELAHFRLRRRTGLRGVVDVNGQCPLVPLARQLADDFAVLDLALADLDLKPVRGRIPQADVPDEWVQLVVV